MESVDRIDTMSREEDVEGAGKFVPSYISNLFLSSEFLPLSCILHLLSSISCHHPNFWQEKATITL